jgi:hypothetical protein
VDLVAPYASSRLGIATHRELGMAGRMPYFNAGVMPVDLRLACGRHQRARVTIATRAARDAVGPGGAERRGRGPLGRSIRAGT